MSEITTDAVVTVSTSAAGGTATDESGPILEGLLRGLGASAVESHIVADDRNAIETLLRDEVSKGTQLVVTTGGTGISRDDVTPEATAAVLDKEIPGISEAIRAESVRLVPTGCLTRGVAGVASTTLIINLPGRPKAVEESFAVIAAALPHAISQMQRSGGRDSH
jgi:molybdenum cofactor synthesis domain-containing protein